MGPWSRCRRHGQRLRPEHHRLPHCLHLLLNLLGVRLLAGLNDAVSAAGLPDPARGLGLLVGAPVGAGRSRDVIDGLTARGFLATEAGESEAWKQRGSGA